MIHPSRFFRDSVSVKNERVKNMVDEIKSNLEPIEDKDLDLKRKFLAGSSEIKAVEKKDTPEIIVEKKEGTVEKESAYSKILSKVKAQAQPSDATSVSGDAQLVNAEMDSEAKIKNLVNLAMQKGVIHAVKVAQHLEDNYTLDEFHDRMLADELHDELIKRGLIKNI